MITTRRSFIKRIATGIIAARFAFLWPSKSIEDDVPCAEAPWAWDNSGESIWEKHGDGTYTTWMDVPVPAGFCHGEISGFEIMEDVTYPPGLIRVVGSQKCS